MSQREEQREIGREMNEDKPRQAEGVSLCGVVVSVSFFGEDSKRVISSVSYRSDIEHASTLTREMISLGKRADTCAVCVR